MLYGHLGNWKVRKSGLLTASEDGELIEVPNRYAVVRNNPVVAGQIDVLGVVGETYRVMQNEELCELLDAVVDESGAHFATAGALDGGRKVFITMKLPGNMLVGGIDRVDLYLAIITSHDGSLATVLIVSPVRIVCSNTLNLALRRSSGLFKVRHTSGAAAAIRREARAALDLSFNYLDEFQAEAEQMINTTLTEARFGEILRENFGVDEEASQGAATRAQHRIDKLMELFTEADTQEEIRGTVWAGFNALTEYADFYSSVQSRGREEDTIRAQKAILDPAFKNRARQLMLAEVK